MSWVDRCAGLNITFRLLDAAYCYRWSSMVYQSACQSRPMNSATTAEPAQNTPAHDWQSIYSKRLSRAEPVRCGCHSVGGRTSMVRMPTGVLDGVYTGATWRIWLNRPCVTAMWPCVKLLSPLFSAGSWPLSKSAWDESRVEGTMLWTEQYRMHRHLWLLQLSPVTMLLSTRETPATKPDRHDVLSNESHSFLQTTQKLDGCLYCLYDG